MNNFETPRLTLRPFTSDDFEVLHKIFTDPFVRKYLWDDEVIPESQTHEILKINKEQFAKEHSGLWAMSEKGKEEIFGFVGLWYFFSEVQPQLLYGLIPEFAHKGYATEASEKIIEYAFNELGFDHIIASTDEPHKASTAVLKRLDFAFVEQKNMDGLETLFFRLDKDT